MAYKKGSKEAMQNRQRLLPSDPFERDLNDGKEWSEDDIRDLKAAWEHGADLQELSLFLCRADWEAVGAKCAELGLDLRWQAHACFCSSHNLIAVLKPSSIIRPRPREVC